MTKLRRKLNSCKLNGAFLEEEGTNRDKNSQGKTISLQGVIKANMRNQPLLCKKAGDRSSERHEGNQSLPKMGRITGEEK